MVPADMPGASLAVSAPVVGLPAPLFPVVVEGAPVLTGGVVELLVRVAELVVLELLDDEEEEEEEDEVVLLSEDTVMVENPP